MTFLCAHSFEEVNFKPGGHLNVTLVALFQVYCKPNGYLGWLRRSKWSIATTYEVELVALETRHDLNDCVLGKKLVLSRRPTSLIHLSVLASALNNQIIKLELK